MNPSTAGHRRRDRGAARGRGDRAPEQQERDPRRRAGGRRAAAKPARLVPTRSVQAGPGRDGLRSTPAGRPTRTAPRWRRPRRACAPARSRGPRATPSSAISPSRRASSSGCSTGEPVAVGPRPPARRPRRPRAAARGRRRRAHDPRRATDGEGADDLVAFVRGAASRPRGRGPRRRPAALSPSVRRRIGRYSPVTWQASRSRSSSSRTTTSSGESLELLLGTVPDVRVIAAVADGRSALEVCRARAARRRARSTTGCRSSTGSRRPPPSATRAPTTAVVVLTATAESEEIDALYEAGAVACLTKDRELDEIVGAVRDAAGRGAALR